MKIHEYQAKAIIRQYDIPTPRGAVASSPDEAFEIAKGLGGRAVIKAQVYAGGRGKAGGIVVASSASEARDVAASMIGTNLITFQTGPAGVPIHKVLVEQPIEVAKEMYLGLTIDRTYHGPVMIASEAGGIEIEEVAATKPDKILREGVDTLIGFQAFQGRSLAANMHLDKALHRPASQIMANLTKIFVDNDCSLVEINPLVVTKDGDLLALDAKLSFDDDALFRHPEFRDLRDKAQEDPLEANAIDAGIAYVKLNGNVGCMVNGAGLAMATMDVINGAGLEPANFLDVGGGASVEKVATACNIMLSDPQVTQILVNVFGGILRCDIAAQGVVKACTEAKTAIPICIRMLGTNLEEGISILRESNLNVTFASSLSEVAQKLAAT